MAVINNLSLTAEMARYCPGTLYNHSCWQASTFYACLSSERGTGGNVCLYLLKRQDTLLFNPILNMCKCPCLDRQINFQKINCPLKSSVFFMPLAHFEDGKNIPLTDCNKTLGPRIRRYVKRKSTRSCLFVTKKKKKYYRKSAHLFYLLPRFFPLF